MTSGRTGTVLDVAPDVGTLGARAPAQVTQHGGRDGLPALPVRAGGGPVLDEEPTLPPSRVLPEPATSAPGRAVGSRYRVLERIGSGATGTVWRGERTDDGLAVAVKLLRPELAGDPDVVTRFVRERSTLLALDHPHLVGVLDLVAEGDLLAIVMPLVQGHDLRHHLGGRATGVPLSRRAATGLLADVADALATVHEAGVVHRDVKPENVLVSGTGGRPTGMLTDFGIASATHDSRLTRSSRFVGTPVYLAPERALGRTSGPPADVYALAVTAYEVLAGHPPFSAADDLAVLRAHVDDRPRRPDGWDAAVWDVVSAGLAKSPADRPDAAELGLGLRAVADRVGVGTVRSVAAPAPDATPGPVRGARIQPAPGPGTAAVDGGHEDGGHEDGSGEDGGQESTRLGRVLPEAPGPDAPRRRRRWPRVLAVVAVVVVLLGAGVVVRLLTAQDDAAPPAQVTYVTVPVESRADSPVPGVVELAFGTPPDGTAGLSVLDAADTVLQSGLAADAPSFTFENVPPGEHCFQVIALVPSDQAPADRPDVAPACATVDEAAAP